MMEDRDDDLLDSYFPDSDPREDIGYGKVQQRRVDSLADWEFLPGKAAGSSAPRPTHPEHLPGLLEKRERVLSLMRECGAGEDDLLPTSYTGFAEVFERFLEKSSGDRAHAAEALSLLLEGILAQKDDPGTVSVLATHALDILHSALKEGSEY